MEKCTKNLTKEEIIMEFGKDHMMESCNRCDNLQYCNGIMSCRIINESEEESK